MTLAARRLTICLSLALAAHAGLFAVVANIGLAPEAIRDRTLTVTFNMLPTQQAVTSRVIAGQAQIGDDHRSQSRRERRPATAPNTTLDSATAIHHLATSGHTQPQPAPTTGKTAQARLARSARQDQRATYLMAWRRRVERYGNRHYPGHLIAQAPRYRLTLGVTLRADGSLHAVRVLQSSGSTALDRAAQQIVRNAGPYAPLPAAVRAQRPTLTFAYDWIFDSTS